MESKWHTRLLNAGAVDSATPTVDAAPAAAPPAAAPGPMPVGSTQDPVKVHTLKDIARRARAKEREGAIRVDPNLTYIMRNPVDYPWAGRQESWYDYLCHDLGYWRRLVYIYLPLRFFGCIILTISIGRVLLSDSFVMTQAAALTAPVSAFSLLTSLLLTFRHSIAYTRFWDAKNQMAQVLMCLRNVSFAFVDSPLSHRRAVAGMIAALFDGLIRAVTQQATTDAKLWALSPRGPWRIGAHATLPPRLLARLDQSPGAQVANVVAELTLSPAMSALDGCTRSAAVFELQNVSHAAASLTMMSGSPVPPIYTIMLTAMIHAFTGAMALLTGLSLANWTSPIAWLLSAGTVALIHTTLHTFYLAARELAMPFKDKLMIPVRKYEAALIHDVYNTLNAVTEEDVVADMNVSERHVPMLGGPAPGAGNSGDSKLGSLQDVQQEQPSDAYIFFPSGWTGRRKGSLTGGTVTPSRSGSNHGDPVRPGGASRDSMV